MGSDEFMSIHSAEKAISIFLFNEETMLTG